MSSPLHTTADPDLFRCSEKSASHFPNFGKAVVVLFLVVFSGCASTIQPVAEGPEVPGLTDTPSWVPQGLWRLPDSRFVVGAYRDTRQKNELGEHIGPVRLSLLSEETPPHHIEILKQGEPLLSHAGGIAIHNGFLYIANALDGRVFRGDWDPDAEAIEVQTFLTNPTSADTVAIGPDGLLWVGQFYLQFTAYNRRLGTWRDQNGRAKHALIIAYEPQTARPVKALAVRGRLQGFAITPDWIVLSCSYGQNRASHLGIYPTPLQGEAHDHVQLPDGTLLPLYHLNVRTKNHKLPPMSEEIFVDRDHIWVVYESGALSRFPRTRNRINAILSYPLPQR